MEGYIFIIICLASGLLALAFQNDSIKERYIEELMDLEFQNEALINANTKLEWYQETTIHQLAKYPLIKLVEGVGIENVVVSKRLNGLISVEIGDVWVNSLGEPYLITNFIGIVKNDIYFGVIPFKNDNPEYL